MVYIIIILWYCCLLGFGCATPTSRSSAPTGLALPTTAWCAVLQCENRVSEVDVVFSHLGYPVVVGLLHLIDGQLMVLLHHS